MLYYLYFAEAGAPKAGLSPTWHSLRTAAGGVSKLAFAPAINAVGEGWYRFDVTRGQTPWDVEAEDLVGVVDGGSALADADRYKPVAITRRGEALAVISGEIELPAGNLRTLPGAVRQGAWL